MHDDEVSEFVVYKRRGLDLFLGFKFLIADLIVIGVSERISIERRTYKKRAKNGLSIWIRISWGMMNTLQKPCIHLNLKSRTTGLPRPEGGFPVLFRSMLRNSAFAKVNKDNAM